MVNIVYNIFKFRVARQEHLFLFSILKFMICNGHLMENNLLLFQVCSQLQPLYMIKIVTHSLSSERDIGIQSEFVPSLMVL